MLYEILGFTIYSSILSGYFHQPEHTGSFELQCIWKDLWFKL